MYVNVKRIKGERERSISRPRVEDKNALLYVFRYVLIGLWFYYGVQTQTLPSSPFRQARAYNSARFIDDHVQFKLNRRVGLIRAVYVRKQLNWFVKRFSNKRESIALCFQQIIYTYKFTERFKSRFYCKVSKKKLKNQINNSMH